MRKNKKTKILGSILLAVTVVAVLVAVGGQFNFIGQKRLDIKTGSQVSNEAANSEKPKYNFYNELSTRKSQLTAQQRRDSLKNIENSKKTYLIKVGAFKNKVQANKRKDKIIKLGYKSTVKKQGKYYSVRLIKVKGLRKAHKIQAELKKHKVKSYLEVVKN